MPGPALVVDGLSKSFAGKRALDDLSFSVERGEIVGLIGRNGAGKSTAFGMLAGLLRPDAGTMRFDGTRLGADRGRFVALIGETPEVYPLLTVWEHLVFVAGLCRLPAGWEPRANDLLVRFGLDGERDVLGNALSKGMRQKTLIAAAVIAATPVLLLDEPMIGLDPLGQRELRAILRDLRADGTAIMLSTHQLEAAEQLCDRVIVLHHGRAVASGTVAELRAGGAASLEDIFVDMTAT